MILFEWGQNDAELGGIQCAGSMGNLLSCGLGDSGLWLNGIPETRESESESGSGGPGRRALAARRMLRVRVGLDECH